MGLPPWEASSSQLFVLVTGSNSGLGYGFCERLIDEFISTPSRDPTSHLILIITTRSPLKTRFTLTRLRSHLRQVVEVSAVAKELKKKALQQGKTYNWQDQAARVHFLGIELDLCNLQSVYSAARKIRGEDGGLGSPDLLTSEGLKRYDGKGIGLKNICIPRLDVLAMNAGTGGWITMDWPMALWDIVFKMPESTTWPRFKIARVGSVLDRHGKILQNREADLDNEATQNLLDANGHVVDDSEKESVLGEVFTANLFGHYILGHQLMPLLCNTEGRTASQRGLMMFISSIECQREHFDLDDFQGILTPRPYESSKRLTDLLALTAHLPSVQKINKTYFDFPTGSDFQKQGSDSKLAGKPDIYIAHPGICATEIAGLQPFLAFFMSVAFYISRIFLGSIWHPIQSYKGACAMVWLALTDRSTLYTMEQRSEDGSGDRRMKWGTCTDRWGNERVRKTEVPGWGMSGVVGEEIDPIGRKSNATDVTKEGREDFEVLGAKCWKEMERMRIEWEERLGKGKN